MTLFKKIFLIRYVDTGEDRFLLTETRDLMEQIRNLQKETSGFQLKTVERIK